MWKTSARGCANRDRSTMGNEREERARRMYVWRNRRKTAWIGSGAVYERKRKSEAIDKKLQTTMIGTGAAWGRKRREEYGEKSGVELYGEGRKKKEQCRGRQRKTDQA